MATLVRDVNADKVERIASMEAVYVEVKYDAELDGLEVTALCETGDFEVRLQRGKQQCEPVVVSAGRNKTVEGWLVVKRRGQGPKNCTVHIRVGDSPSWPIIVEINV